MAKLVTFNTNNKNDPQESINGGGYQKGIPLPILISTDHQIGHMAPADRRKESVMSDYFDYMELKRFVYKLYKDGVWDGLSQEIKRLYWCDLQRLWRRVKAGIDIDAIDDRQNEDDARILGITPDIEQNDEYDRGSKFSGKAKICPKYQRPLSLERAYEDFGCEPASSFSVEDYIVQKETSQELHIAIKTLDERKQTILASYYFEGQTERMIGSNLGIAQRTVNYQKDKSHKELKKIMKDLF